MSELAELVLHVGAPHSGGDVLRRSLDALRPQLREHGVGYLDHAQLAALPSAAGWACRRGYDRRLAERFAAELAAAATAARPADGVLVLASDRLLGGRALGRGDVERFRPWAESSIGQVIAALRPRRVSVVLHTRRQDRLLEHAYIRRVMAGEPTTFAQCFPFRLRPVLDYGELVGRLAAIPAVTRVLVDPLEAHAAGDVAGLVDRFLGAVDLGGRLDLRVLAEVAPDRVYSAEGVRVSRALLGHFETPEEYERWRAFAVQTFGVPNTDEASTEVIGKRLRQQIVRAYEPANRELFRAHAPHVPVHLYDLAAPPSAGARPASGGPRAGLAHRAVGRAVRRWRG